MSSSASHCWSPSHALAVPGIVPVPDELPSHGRAVSCSGDPSWFRSRRVWPPLARTAVFALEPRPLKYLTSLLLPFGMFELFVVTTVSHWNSSQRLTPTLSCRTSKPGLAYSRLMFRRIIPEKAAT